MALFLLPTASGNDARMTTVETTHELMAMPYDPTVNQAAKLDKILTNLAHHPHWYSAPSTEWERAIAASIIIHDPYNKVWEVWKGSELVGLLLLSRVSPRVDALWHFAFFDQQLAGKRKLLLSFLRQCFTPTDEGGLGYQRISLEIPESAPSMVSFARRKLGFTYEGERAVAHNPAFEKAFPLMIRDNEHPQIWLAKQGSRREASHWYEDKWVDVLCLRHTAEEFTAFAEGVV